MDGPNSSNVFISPEWIEKLRSYATSLIDRLESDLTAIADTGVSLEAKDRQPLTIDPYQSKDEERERQKDRVFLARTTDPLFDHSQEDVAFLKSWLGQLERNSKPLILLAPFGGGKSVTLGLFTLVLARTLKEWCDSRSLDGELPRVPFPVRLRKWTGEGTLWAYMISDAQEHVDPNPCHFDDPVQHRLTASELRHLREHCQLLPLFDGLDELAESGKDEAGLATTPRADAIRQIYQDRYYGNQHILSSREGHGVEISPFSANAMLRTLNRLDETEARAFIQRRLGIDLANIGHPVRMAYQECQPAINELFRRPLFLMAWCAKAEAWLISGGRTQLPASISGLMEAVLEHVLNQRICDHSTGDDSDYSTVRKKLLRNRHRLGAVLAIHADEGFGVAANIPHQCVENGFHRHALKNKQQYERYAMFAVKTGLLIKRSSGTYVEKIPIVEYLVGYYYAWLAEEQQDKDVVTSQHRQLAFNFQRRFWWPDYEEVWLYAFDILWRGNPSQRQFAKELSQWVLSLSEQCAACKNGVREPISLWRYALRILLPVAEELCGNTSRGLIDDAMKQCETEANQRWKILRKPLEDLHDTAQRRPELISRWLCDRLDDVAYQSQWTHIASTIGTIGSLLDAKTIVKLAEYLRRSEYEAAWAGIANVFGHVTADSGLDVFEHMMVYLGDDKYRHAWQAMVYALSNSGAHLKIDAIAKLFGYLTDEKHHEEYWSMALTLGQIANNLGPEASEMLLRYLSDEKHQDAWGAIAIALYYPAKYLNPQAVKQLLDYLGNDQYEKEWQSIAFVLVGTTAYIGFDTMEPELKSVIKYLSIGKYRYAWRPIADFVMNAHVHSGVQPICQLRMCLTDVEYQDAWEEIAGAFTESKVQLSSRDIEQLVMYFYDMRYTYAWEPIAVAVSNSAMNIGTIAFRQLLRCLSDNECQASWGCVAAVVSSAATQMTRYDVAQLLVYLGDERYQYAWWAMAKSIGNSLTFLDDSSTRQLLVYLGDVKYERAWPAIAKTLGSVATHLDLSQA